MTAKTIEDVAREFDGLPEVTELGEPVAGAMFSDRFVDVDHMPREVRSNPFSDEIDRAASRPPMEPFVKLMIALLLIVVGLAFGMLVFGQ